MKFLQKLFHRHDWRIANEVTVEVSYFFGRGGSDGLLRLSRCAKCGAKRARVIGATRSTEISVPYAEMILDQEEE